MRWGRLGDFGLALVCAASALAGAYLTVRAFGTTEEPFTLGTVSVRAGPAWDGRVDVYVPIVDWGVRASPYEAPVAVQPGSGRLIAKRRSRHSAPAQPPRRG